ncbi:MAG: hypothetical protein HRU38_21850 [Saccharospirillaceae bacterium]|nr:hypothetical protein [Pseudomonadales bacterium]NRB81275.1 hypothetical protein [Saccharospirillaceae bacterium]
MKRINVILLLLLLSQNAISIDLELNKKLPDSAIESEYDKILISPSQFVNSYDYEYLNNQFTIGVISDEDVIKYISTYDTGFKTSEGVYIGMTLSELKKVTDNSIFTEYGWAHYIELPSGWYAAFCISQSCTSENVKLSSKISWLFKR